MVAKPQCHCVHVLLSDTLPEVCGVVVAHADKACKLADLRMLDRISGTAWTGGWQVVNRPGVL